MVSFLDEKHHFMAYALRVGRRNQGITGENPSVGCVIVSPVGEVLGVGCTAPSGRPHAEIEALKMAGERARGAIVYVTFEPCCHHGVSPPCVESLIQAGVARVVVAVEDCDLRVSGRGIAALRAQGIDVEVGVFQQKARQDLAGFFSRILRGVPFVTVHLAISQNEKIAAVPGQPTAITGESALRYSHWLRACSDAIFVGAQTVRSDNPSLTCRLSGLKERSPLRIVVDTSLSLPYGPRMSLLQDRAFAPLLVVTTRTEPSEAADFLKKEGVEVLVVPQVSGKCDLAALLQILGSRGVNTLLVEGGAHLVTSFFEGGYVDRLALFKAPKELPETGLPALVGDKTLSQTIKDYHMAETMYLHFGVDTLTIYERKHH